VRRRDASTEGVMTLSLQLAFPLALSCEPGLLSCFEAARLSPGSSSHSLIQVIRLFVQFAINWFAPPPIKNPFHPLRTKGTLPRYHLDSQATGLSSLTGQASGLRCNGLTRAVLLPARVSSAVTPNDFGQCMLRRLPACDLLLCQLPLAYYFWINIFNCL
jgi:hypothetical protein